MKSTDQQLAKRLLKRKTSGGKILPFTTRQKFGYSLWGVLVVIAIVLGNLYPNNPVTWFLIGAVLAAVVREFVWFKSARMAWPFNEKVIDWKKVKELSDDAKSE